MLDDGKCKLNVAKNRRNEHKQLHTQYLQITAENICRKFNNQYGTERSCTPNIYCAICPNVWHLAYIHLILEFSKLIIVWLTNFD